MSKAITTGMDPTALRRLVDDNNRDIEASTAFNTRKAYQADWKTFTAWCAANGFQALPASPQVLAAYLTHLANAGRRVSTIERALTGISQAHKLKGLPSPRSDRRVQKTLEGVTRRVGAAQHGKAPILGELLLKLVDGIADDLTGARDRAILTLGFAGAFRRSELVALNVEDLAFGPEGLTVTLRRSKTDQRGEGRLVGIAPTKAAAVCPIRALKAWLELAEAAEGPVFVSFSPMHYGRRLCGSAVADIVKKHATRVGLDPAKFAGHSLRAGFATTAARAGKTERAIMKQTGHKSSAMLARYIREVGLFEDNASEGLL